jgi:hypothetical protein
MDEKEENELDEERSKKLKDLTKRSSAALKGFMAEAAEIVLGPEQKEKIETKLRQTFADRGLSFTLTQMNAFLEGMEFGSTATRKDESMTMTVMCALRGMVEQRKKDVELKTPKI